MGTSVTRWPAYFSVFCHLKQWKLAPKGHKFANVGSAICKVKYKPSKICQRFVNFCQSDAISPNLVTLILSYWKRNKFCESLECNWLQSVLKICLWDYFLGCTWIKRVVIPTYDGPIARSLVFFKKNGPITASFLFIFVLFSLQFQ